VLSLPLHGSNALLTIPPGSWDDHARDINTLIRHLPQPGAEAPAFLQAPSSTAKSHRLVGVGHSFSALLGSEPSQQRLTWTPQAEQASCVLALLTQTCWTASCWSTP
jgi:hypothetical protein